MKAKIHLSAMNKLWVSLITSKKAPWGARKPEEKRRFYTSMPKHLAKCALVYEIGELNFRTNRKYESLKKYGTLECVVPGCCQLDTLDHAMQCYGYSTKYKEGSSPTAWFEYISALDLERFQKYKTSLIKYNN